MSLVIVFRAITLAKIAALSLTPPLPVSPPL